MKTKIRKIRNYLARFDRAVAEQPKRKKRKRMADDLDEDGTSQMRYDLGTKIHLREEKVRPDISRSICS